MEALQEETKVHDSPLTLVAQIFELGSSLEVEKKHHYETSNVVAKADWRVEKAQKILQQEKETHVEATETHEEEVVSLKERFRESFQKIMRGVYEVLD